MTRTIAVVALAAFTAGILVSNALPGEARADKTVTYLSAGVKWTAYHAWPDGDSGAIRAEICAHPMTSDGGVGPDSCHSVSLPASNAIAVDTVAIANGKGVPFWRGREGL